MSNSPEEVKFGDFIKVYNSRKVNGHKVHNIVEFEFAPETLKYALENHIVKVAESDFSIDRCLTEGDVGIPITEENEKLIRIIRKQIKQLIRNINKLMATSETIE